MEEAKKLAAPKDSSEAMRNPITLVDFHLPVEEDEGKPQVFSGNRISRIGYNSDLEDSKTGDEPPLGDQLVVPPTDEDYCDDFEDDEDTYLSYEVLN